MSEDRGERRPRPRGGRRPRRKVCSFCVDKIEYIDYKDINRLRRFTNERGKILPRRMSGNCAIRPKAKLLRVRSEQFFYQSLTTFRAQKSERSISRPMMTFRMSMNCTQK